MPSGDEHLDNPNEDPDESPVIRELRAKAKRTDDAESKVSDLERRLAVAEAGLTSLNPRQRTALLAAHEGDLDPDAVRATAAELGFIQAPEPSAQTPPDERAAHERVAAAGAGAEPAGARPNTAAELAAAKTQDELLAILDRENMRSDEAVRPSRL